MRAETELEKLLIKQLSELAQAHELHFKQLSDAQLQLQDAHQQQLILIDALSRRVEELLTLLQS